MLGFNQKQFLKENPHIAAHWEEYDMCRLKEFVSFEKPTGSEGKKKLVLVEYPTGFSHFPGPGSLEDQDYVKMKIFYAFLRGERLGCGDVMQR